MICTLKQLFNNTWLIQWDGLQKSYIKTCNRFFKAHYLTNKDYPLNIVMVKLALVYTPQAFYKALENGIKFEYQTYTYILKSGARGYTNLTMIFTKTNEIKLNHNITYSLHNELAKMGVINDDLGDILKALLIKDI